MKDPKTILITGASSGIGKEAAIRYATAGHNVIGCARRFSKLEELQSKLGKNFTPVQTDLAVTKDIDKLFAKVNNEHGPLDILINNAGVGYETSLIEGDPKHWEQMIMINLLAVAQCTRKALDIMIKEDSGHIFTISSMSAHRVAEGGGVYSASKYGVRALLEGLRQELAIKKSKVRSTMVSPGFVQTEFYEHYYHDQDQAEIDHMFNQMQSLRASDIVDAIDYAYKTPEHVGVNDILIRPLEQIG